MHPLRRALLSLAVLLLASLATRQAIRQAKPPPPPPASQNESVLALPIDEIESVSVVAWQGAFAARRSGESWVINFFQLNPGVLATIGGEPETPATPERISATVEDLLVEVVGLPRVDRFSRGEQPWSAFGLDQPTLSISIQRVSGGAVTIEVGASTSSAAGLYARVVEGVQAGQGVEGDEVLTLGTLFSAQVDAAFWRLRGLKLNSPTASAKT